MLAIYAGPDGLTQLAWAYTSADSVSLQLKVPGTTPVPYGSHALYFESAGIQTYHARLSSKFWVSNYGQVLLASLPFRLEGSSNQPFLNAGSCKDLPNENMLCIPEDTGQYLGKEGLYCAEGNISRVVNMPKCGQCRRGEAGMTCKPCPRGSFADKEDSPVCTVCPSSFSTKAEGTGQDCAEVKGCCISCAMLEEHAPQCVTSAITTTAIRVATTTPPPTIKTLTTEARGITTTTPPVVVFDTPPPAKMTCGDGIQTPAPENKCWTSAFGGLKATIRDSIVSPCKQATVSTDCIPYAHKMPLARPCCLSFNHECV